MISTVCLKKSTSLLPVHAARYMTLAWLLVSQNTEGQAIKYSSEFLHFKGVMVEPHVV